MAARQLPVIPTPAKPLTICLTGGKWCPPLLNGRPSFGERAGVRGKVPSVSNLPSPFARTLSHHRVPFFDASAPVRCRPRSQPLLNDKLPPPTSLSQPAPLELLDDKHPPHSSSQWGRASLTAHTLLACLYRLRAPEKVSKIIQKISRKSLCQNVSRTAPNRPTFPHPNCLCANCAKMSHPHV